MILDLVRKKGITEGANDTGTDNLDADDKSLGTNLSSDRSHTYALALKSNREAGQDRA